ncbi:hypothetical protein AOQ84DRAFT_65643 [Glonium stellatum]|uniref:Uncharacterized protein n=1 Tax=Glonium stellatum TaxID=574774 RepID=A0A8E2EY56_9PEZI|nr:hypothetical protein AOQ84DRAFT_65643 [Glonium stellatum]
MASSNRLSCGPANSRAFGRAQSVACWSIFCSQATRTCATVSPGSQPIRSQLSASCHVFLRLPAHQPISPSLHRRLCYCRASAPRSCRWLPILTCAGNGQTSA